MLHTLLCITTLTDLQRLLQYVTGSDSPPPAGFAAGYITVQLLDTDAVSDATCLLKLTLPSRFEKYEDFCQCM